MERSEIFLMIAIPFLILILCSKLVFFDLPFYYNELEKYKITREVPQAKEITTNIINFFNDKEELTYSFIEKEKIHLSDIRDLSRSFAILFYILLVIFIFYLFHLIFLKKYKKIAISFKFGGIITLIILLIIMLSTKINFNSFFTQIHLVLFNNDYWLLPEDSTLIKLFPLDFFQDAIKRIILNSSLFSIGFIISGFVLEKWKRK